MIDRSKTLSGKIITVASDPIGEVIAEYKPTAIIMDVEGAEIELLGSVDLSGANKMIVELHPHITGQKAVDDLEKEFADQGFVKSETAHRTVFFQKSE